MIIYHKIQCYVNLKLKSNTKIAILLILAAIISYFLLINIVNYNFTTLTTPLTSQHYENLFDVNCIDLICNN